MDGFSIDKYLEELRLLTNIDSGSRNPEGLAKMADYFREKYVSLGWKVETYLPETQLSPCLIITNTDRMNYDVLLLGHMDTVFGKGEAKKRPFTIDGDKAYGPGVIDMKAGLLSLYYALESISGAENLSLCVLLNSDEEIGSHASEDLIKKLAANSRCCLVMEPARENGSLVLERKGLGGFSVEFFGLSAHAGVEPEKGINAIEEMGHWIVELQKLNNPELGTSFNVGVVSGGTVSNVIPDYAKLKADLRYMDSKEVERIKGRIEYMSQNPWVKGVKTVVKGGVNRPPMRSNEETINLCRIVEDSANSKGIKFGWAVTGGGSDGNFAAAAGIPVLDGFGPVGARAHSENEYLLIDSVKPRIELLKDVIIKICKS